MPLSCGFPTLRLLSPWWMPPNNSLPFGFLSRICCILNLRLHPDSWFALSGPLLSFTFQPIFRLTWLSDASSDDYPLILTSVNIREIELYQDPQHLRKQVSSPEPLLSLSKPLKTTGDWPSGPWFPGSFYCSPPPSICLGPHYPNEIWSANYIWIFNFLVATFLKRGEKNRWN